MHLQGAGGRQGEIMPDSFRSSFEHSINAWDQPSEEDFDYVITDSVLGKAGDTQKGQCADDTWKANVLQQRLTNQPEYNKPDEAHLCSGNDTRRFKICSYRRQQQAGFWCMDPRTTILHKTNVAGCGFMYPGKDILSKTNVANAEHQNEQVVGQMTR